MPYPLTSVGRGEDPNWDSQVVTAFFFFGVEARASPEPKWPSLSAIPLSPVSVLLYVHRNRADY